MYRIITAALIATLLLSSCAQLPYAQPSGPNTASLTFENNSLKAAAIHGFEKNENCSGQSVSFRQNKGIQSKEKFEIKVKANQPISIAFTLGELSQNFSNRVDVTSCFIVGSFTPTAGQKYFARFSDNPSNCYLAIVRKSASGEIAEPTYRQREMTGSSCK